MNIDIFEGKSLLHIVNTLFIYINTRTKASKKFSEFFFSINITWHCLESVYWKNYFNLAEIFVLGIFEIGNQTECSRNEQRSVIKFLQAVNCKPCEIDKRMCDVYVEANFSKKIFTDWLKIGLPWRARVKKKTVNLLETQLLATKEKFPGAEVKKEG